MRKFTLIAALLLGSIAAKAQPKQVCTFETLTLPTNDTYYVNYSNLGNDVGFDEKNVHFSCVFDDFGFGSYHVNGFVYSNKKDLTDTTYTNSYTCLGGKGYNNSNTYVISFWDSCIINLKGMQRHNNMDYAGFYINNTVYTNSVIKYGGNGAKPFGGVSGNDTDYLKVVVYGYENGTLKNDSVEIYLADYRPMDNTKDSIITDWKWIQLMKLGRVDSLMFVMRTTDMNQFGPLTPFYFAMDDFTVFERESVDKTNILVAKVYPNPAVNILYVENNTDVIKQAAIYDMSGKQMLAQSIKDKVTSLPVAQLVPGIYIVQLQGEGKTANMRFVKQ